MGNSLRDWAPTRRSYVGIRVLGAMEYPEGSEARRTLGEFLRGAEVLDGRVSTPVRGVNPAFRLEEVAAAHRNPEDLTWSVEPVYAYGEEGAWSDVPPWWTLRKKKSLYYNGMGHGDFTRLVQQIGVVMIHDADDARRTLPKMQDVMAYIATLRPPRFPGAIDAGRRTRGESVFEAKCAECHGTYGERETYPNRVIPIEQVGTDGTYARRVRGSGLDDWFNSSWFAGAGAAYSRAELGYVAPPLDGVWCTAPYFHNGSVPTLEGVLNSRVRPGRWQRSFRDDDYDVDSPGWRYVVPADGAGPSREVYDTTIPGCGNGGHTYGDDLDEGDRRAVIEYLKTL